MRFSDLLIDIAVAAAAASIFLFFLIGLINVVRWVL